MISRIFYLGLLAILPMCLLSCGNNSKNKVEQTKVIKERQSGLLNSHENKPINSRLPIGEPEEECAKGKKEFVDFLLLFDEEKVSIIQKHIQFPLTVANVWDEYTSLGYTIYHDVKIDLPTHAIKEIRAAGCDVLGDLSEVNVDEKVKCRYINERYYFTTYCNGYFPLYTFRRIENNLVLVAYDLLYDGYNRGLDNLPDDVFLNETIEANNMAHISNIGIRVVTVLINGKKIENGMVTKDYYEEIGNKVNSISIKIENTINSELNYEPEALYAVFQHGISCAGNYYNQDRVYSGKKLIVGPGKSQEIKLDLEKIRKEKLEGNKSCREFGHFYLYEEMREISEDHHRICAWIPIR
ncbi:MAG: hypothetical protein GY847_25805 [Proteobacteria bacterium]|nr:hypothetical protein [Pseudomonadota bacterium]